jgi:hypothetical protein
MDRHGRQTQLAEIGSAGQARIASARVEVAGEGLASLVAARYLAGAGVAAVRVRSAELAAAVSRVDGAVRAQVDPTLPDGPLDAPFDLRDPAACSVASGARTALNMLRAVLAARAPGGEP